LSIYNVSYSVISKECTLRLNGCNPHSTCIPVVLEPWKLDQPTRTRRISTCSNTAYVCTRYQTRSNSKGNCAYHNFGSAAINTQPRQQALTVRCTCLIGWRMRHVICWPPAAPHMHLSSVVCAEHVPFAVVASAPVMNSISRILTHRSLTWH
jgi:hypothetical protein